VKCAFSIFHVDDDEHDRMFVARALNRYRESVHLRQFADGEAARQALDQIAIPEAEAPHLILADIKMPKLNGLELAEWVSRSRFKCVPVVILTSSHLPADMVRAIHCGARSFVTKPVNLAELNEIIGNVLTYWQDVCRVHETQRLIIGQC
jgi:DNA-binding response OmpR family regulator